MASCTAPPPHWCQLLRQHLRALLLPLHEVIFAATYACLYIPLHVRMLCAWWTMLSNMTSSSTHYFNAGQEFVVRGPEPAALPWIRRVAASVPSSPRILTFQLHRPAWWRAMCQGAGSSASPGHEGSRGKLCFRDP